MERGKEFMIYADTHVILWLYEGILDNFTNNGKSLLEEHAIIISPAVSLELEFLYEIGRIKTTAKKIIHSLKKPLDLQISALPLADIIEHAINLKWTRDPFDRLIAANALCDDVKLLTKDKTIHKNCECAIW
jgi:PIN domain nuclease of toxin-antitoxin system